MTDTRYQRSDDILFTDVGDDVVALNVSRGLCYGMEDVTRAVWDMLAEPVELAEICTRLTQRYDVDAATCRSEVAALIEQLVDEDLIKAV